MSDLIDRDVPDNNVEDMISRQVAIDKFEPWLKVSGYSEGELNMLKAVLYELRFLPSAQPELIRCHECKHYDGRPCGKVDWYNSADDFCSRAERRKDE